MSNIFEQATRKALRFPSLRGELTTEQLWQLPLQAKTGFDLDNVAKQVNSELKAVTEESFVSTSHSPAKDKFELMLTVVKRIIQVKLAEAENLKSMAEKEAKRQKLLQALARHQDAALEAMTPEELEAQLKALG